MTVPFSQQFTANAQLLVQQIDPVADRVLVAAVPQEDYRSASFLDQRIMVNRRPCQWMPWTEIERAGTGIAPDAHFIFHIGHVGSTLISRLLGEHADFFCVREPVILRNAAEVRTALDGPASPWQPDIFPVRLDHMIRWLSRSFAADQRSIVKATSWVSELAGDLLQDGRRGLFLYSPLPVYLATILAGEASRSEIGAMSAARLDRLTKRLGASPANLWELDEAQRIALAWVAEMTALQAAEQADDIMWLDFDHFLADPANVLMKIVRHFGSEMSGSEAGALTSGPIMHSYSKAPEHDYSPGLRADLLAQAQATHHIAIAAATEWLSRLADDHPAIASAMEFAGEPA